MLSEKDRAELDAWCASEGATLRQRPKAAYGCNCGRRFEMEEDLREHLCWQLRNSEHPRGRKLERPVADRIIKQGKR